MACPPKPAAAGVRRLSELLAEQQEPFSLDAYLLQKGYPERSLPAPLCWSILSAGHGLHRRSSRFLLLKRKLTELLHPKASSRDDDNKKTFLRSVSVSDSASKNNDHDHLCSPPSLRWKGWEVERSPVSVLDLPSSEEDSSCSCAFLSMTDEDETKDLDGFDFKELLELASSPACNSVTKSRKQLDEPEKLVPDYEQDEIASAITSMTFQPHTREIGTHVEEAIFEDIREAVILEMISFCCCTS